MQSTLFASAKKHSLVVLGFLAATGLEARAQVILTGLYSQNFDGLAASGSSSSVPTGWYINETGSGADATYQADNGTISTGNTYSFGSTGSSDRALGMIRNGPVVSTIGAQFKNQTGVTITTVTIHYFGEVWRLGTPAQTFHGGIHVDDQAVVDRIDFQYSVNATSLTTGTWTDFNRLDVICPNTLAVGAQNGNANALRRDLSAQFAVIVPVNSSLWIRWVDYDSAATVEDGYGVDDFYLMPNYITTPSVPEPAETAFAVSVGLIAFQTVRRRLRAPRHASAESSRLDSKL